MKLRTGRIAFLAGAAALAGLTTAKTALADVIFSNLGPGSTFIINREYDTNATFLATAFVTTGGGNLDTVSTPLFSLTPPVEIGLYTDGGTHPGSLIESWSVPAPGVPGILTTFSSVIHPSLAAATRYWLVIDQTHAEQVAWYENDQSMPGGIWFGFDLNNLLEAVPASPMPALELASTAAAPVPEPATTLLFLASGLLLLAPGWTGRRA